MCSMHIEESWKHFGLNDDFQKVQLSLQDMDNFIGSKLAGKNNALDIFS